MININELRRGNLIKFTETDEIVKVLGIDADELGITCEFKDEGDLWVECRLFSSIPLTEEWLIKLGFERGQIIIDCGILSVDDCIVRLEYKGNIINLGKRKYVHQLQNLFYALTGEELTLTK